MFALLFPNQLMLPNTSLDTKHRKVPIYMNEFSQTSLKGQGLLIFEQGIARVYSIGELVL